jgi:hypothetical protein
MSGGSTRDTGAAIPPHQQAGYEAVYEVIRAKPGDAWRNALIWRAVEVYRAAADHASYQASEHGAASDVDQSNRAYGAEQRAEQAEAVIERARSDLFVMAERCILQAGHARQRGDAQREREWVVVAEHARKILAALGQPPAEKETQDPNPGTDAR